MIYLGIAAGIFLLELFLKNRTEQCRQEGSERQVLGGRVLLRNYHNRGAFLDAGAQVSPLVAVISLGLTFVAVLFLVLTLGQKGRRLLKAGLALLVGGAGSNTYDRLRRRYVVDYISFGVSWKPLRRIVFNLADFCIMIGAVMAACGWEEKR